MFCALIFNTVLGQSLNSEVVAKVDMDSRDQFLRITAFAINKTAISQSLKYTLSVVRTDANGNRNKNDQQGFFILESEQKKSLAETTININKEDRTIIFLLIFRQEQVIGKDRIVINGFEGEDELRPIVVEREELFDHPTQNDQVIDQKQNDGVILRGVVIEDTKTKPASDFYQMFYSAYLANNINGQKIVHVVEKIAMGRSTKIQILVDQDLVFEFFLNPRQEYLKQMSEQAIFRVRRYFQVLENKQNQQQKY